MLNDRYHKQSEPILIIPPQVRNDQNSFPNYIQDNIYENLSGDWGKFYYSPPDQGYDSDDPGFLYNYSPENPRAMPEPRAMPMPDSEPRAMPLDQETTMQSKYLKSLFRESLVKIYKKCLITGVHQLECDAAHIIPVNICQKYKLYYIYHKYNGLLISKNLHITYDNYIWTFDIFDLKPVENNSDKVLIKPIIKHNLQHESGFSINKYISQYFQVPIKSLPYLYIHYHIFLEVNYKQTKPNYPLLYQSYIKSDPIFQHLLQNPQNIWNLPTTNNNQSEEDQISVIIDKKYDTSSMLEYLVIPKYQPFRNCYWKFIDEDIECPERDIFEAFIEYQQNP